MKTSRYDRAVWCKHGCGLGVDPEVWPDELEADGAYDCGRHRLDGVRLIPRNGEAYCVSGDFSFTWEDVRLIRAMTRRILELDPDNSRMRFATSEDPPVPR